MISISGAASPRDESHECERIKYDARGPQQASVEALHSLQDEAASRLTDEMRSRAQQAVVNVWGREYVKLWRGDRSSCLWLTSRNTPDLRQFNVFMPMLRFKYFRTMLSLRHSESKHCAWVSLDPPLS